VIYLQEFVAIDRGGKEAYLESLRTRWVPYAERTRGMKLVWMGSTIGSTAAWPETMAIWELRNWAHYADVCARMYSESADEEEVRSWWKDVAKLRLRSRSQTLAGASFCPTLDELLQRGVAGTAFAFSTAKIRPGTLRVFLAALQGRTALEAERGRHLVGAYEVAFTNDTVYSVWAHRTLEELASYEREFRGDPRDADWRRAMEGVMENWSEHWGFATPGSPLWPRDYETDTRVW
jgi:hypothetical protein